MPLVPPRSVPLPGPRRRKMKRPRRPRPPKRGGTGLLDLFKFMNSGPRVNLNKPPRMPVPGRGGRRRFPPRRPAAPAPRAPNPRDYPSR